MIFRTSLAMLLGTSLLACSSSSFSTQGANSSESGGSDAGNQSSTGGANASGASGSSGSGTSGSGNGGTSGSTGAGGSGDGGTAGSSGAAGSGVGGTSGSGNGGSSGTAGSGNGGASGSSGAGGVTGSCSFTTAPPVPAPPDASAPLQEQANAEKLRYLDVLVGRYLRGDVAVYRGTGKAQDNASALANTIVYGPRPDGVIPDGPVIAMLNDKPAQPPGSSALLVMHGLPADKHVIFRQSSANPTLTEVSLLSGVATTASLATSCSGCAPALATRPANISFQDLTATGIVTVFMGYAGQGGHYVDVTAKVVASADLDLADPCTITFDDLLVLTASTGPNEIDSQLKAFELVGNEMIWHSGGAFTVGGAPPCPLVQTYKVDVFVDLNDLGHYGTRNYVPGTPFTQCQPVPAP